MSDKKDIVIRAIDLSVGNNPHSDDSEIDNTEIDNSEIDDSEIDNSEIDYPETDDSEIDNPWKQPFILITWGLILTTFTLNFLLLQYILLTIGIGVMLLGYQKLKKCNHWFNAAWTLAITNLIWHMVHLAILATPINHVYTNNLIIKVAIIVFKLAQFIVLRNALKDVYKQAGMKPERDPLLSAIIWTIILSVCSFIPYVNVWIITIPLLIAYIIILYSFHKVGDELSQAKLLFIEAPVKINSRLIMCSYLVISLLLILISCTFANHITLKNTAVLPTTSNLDLRDKLVELEFPTNIISDISDQDISLLKDAVLIDSFQESLNFDPIQVTTKISENAYRTYSKPGDCNLEATTVYIEMPNQILYIIEYFDWMDRKAYWHDGFTIWGEDGIELINGVLLYQKNDTNYTAPIPRLKCENVTSNDWFGVNDQRQISGAVNYPFGSQRQRGYIMYRVQLPEKKWIGLNCLNYVHNEHPFQYPYSETEERILTGNLMSNDNRKQHYTTFEMQAFRDNE